MSIKVMTDVWEHSSQKGSRLLLLLAIADHADDDGVAWPGIDTLARKTRMSRRQTINNIRAVIDAGELEVIERGGDGAKDTNRYRVITKGAKSAPSRQTKGAILANKGAISGNKGATAIAPEPSLEPSTEPSDRTSSSKKRRREVPPPVKRPPTWQTRDPVADRSELLRSPYRPDVPAPADVDGDIELILAWQELRQEWDDRRHRRAG